MRTTSLYLKLFIILILNLSVVKCLIRFTPVLELPQGRVRGLETQRGDYRKYLGIPYATVTERFNDPGPAPSWDDVFNATRDTIACAQYHERLGFPTGQENCLIINVFTPGQVSLKNPLPVMVYIHGGGYYFGRSNSFIYNPEPIIKKNVIVVSLNYRLGAFGFLCLRVKGAPGNAGLKDQVAALQWIKQNIRYFGGDPQSVTIFGESAGSASVNLLVMSKESQGLFHRAIMESGTSLSPFSFAYDPIERAALVAARMGYNTKNPYELLRIFKNASTNEIIMASVADNNYELLSRYVFRPCAEKQVFGSSKPFMTKTPKQILESGNFNKVPVIIGYNNKEGIYYLNRFDDNTLMEVNLNFEYLLPDNLYFTSPEQKTSVANEIRDFYFGEKTINNESKDTLVDYISDVFFHYPAAKVTEYLLYGGLPVYNYYFQYDSYRNLGKILSGGWGMPGATHTDELFYLFQPIVLWPLPRITKDVAVIDKMTSLWTNFARHGDPTAIMSSAVQIKWESSDNDTLRFLTIDTKLRMGLLPNPKRIDFWKYIYSNYGVHPEQKTSVANEIRDFYFGEKTINNESKDTLVDYISDVFFHYPAAKVTEYLLYGGLPVYNYYFQYDSYRNLGKILSGGWGMPGATHTDELFYLFQPIVLWPLPRITKDVAVIDKMTSLWTNFARHGDPTAIMSSAVQIKWESSDNDTLRFLTIDTKLRMGLLPNPKRIDFWKYIYSNYGVQ